MRFTTTRGEWMAAAAALSEAGYLVPRPRFGGGVRRLGAPGQGRRGWARGRARVAEPPGQHLSCNRLPSTPSGAARRHAHTRPRQPARTHIQHTHTRTGAQGPHTRARARTSSRPRPGPRRPPSAASPPSARGRLREPGRRGRCARAPADRFLGV